jgi:tetratricopeptide (TPR) repeat protein
MRVLQDQGAALAEVNLGRVLDAMHKRNYDIAVSLARQVYPDGSPNAADHLSLGRIYAAAGRPDEAGREFRLAVKWGPGVPENWLVLVQHLVQRKQLDQARAEVERAGKALPPDRATLTLAMCAMLMGDGAQAEALVKRAMEAEGKADDLAALRLAADISLTIKHLDAARAYADRIAASPAAMPSDRARANRTRAVLGLSTNRPADRRRAMELLESNLTSDPESVEDLTLKATILALDPARRGDAVAILARLAEMNRLQDEPRFLLAQLHLAQGEAAKYEDEMLGLLKAKDPRQLAHYVNHWIDRNRLDQAGRWLAELKQADPRSRSALELEARLLDASKRRPEVLALLEARGREVPDEIGAVADLLNRYGFPKEAEAAYRAFIARDPKQPERVLALALFLGRQDRPAEAIDVLKRAWTTCPPEQVAVAALEVFNAPSADEVQKRQVDTWVTEAVSKRPDAALLASKLGVIRILQGRYDEAESILRRLLAAHPDLPDALNSLAWLIALRDPGKAEEAVRLTDRAIALRGDAVSLADTRAVARIRLGQIDQALDDLVAIRKRAPENPTYAFHLAWAYLAKGQRERARAQLQEAEKFGLRARRLDPLELAVFQRLQKELSPG